jgi:hypothetical protein
MIELIKKAGVYSLVKQNGYLRIYIGDEMAMEWKNNADNLKKAMQCIEATIASGEVKDNQKND